MMIVVVMLVMVDCWRVSDLRLEMGQQLPSRFDSLLGRPRRRLIWLCKGQREVQEIIEMRFREESEESSSFCDYSGQYRESADCFWPVLPCLAPASKTSTDKTRQDKTARLANRLFCSGYSCWLPFILLAFALDCWPLIKFDLNCWNCWNCWNSIQIALAPLSLCLRISTSPGASSASISPGTTRIFDLPLPAPHPLTAKLSLLLFSNHPASGPAQLVLLCSPSLRFPSTRPISSRCGQRCFPGSLPLLSQQGRFTSRHSSRFGK